jgi:hypothetical protein
LKPEYYFAWLTEGGGLIGDREKKRIKKVENSCKSKDIR